MAPWGRSPGRFIELWPGIPGIAYFVGTVSGNLYAALDDNLADASLGAAAPTLNTTGNLAMWPTTVELFADAFRKTVGDTTGAIYTVISSQPYCYRFNYTNSADGDTYSSSFMAMAGSYTGRWLYVKGPGAGKVDIYVDGVSVATAVDLYAGSNTYNHVLNISSFNLAYNGWHKVEIVVNGHNASSNAYNCTFTKLTLLGPVA